MSGLEVEETKSVQFVSSTSKMRFRLVKLYVIKQTGKLNGSDCFQKSWCAIGIGFSSTEKKGQEWKDQGYQTRSILDLEIICNCDGGGGRDEWSAEHITKRYSLHHEIERIINYTNSFPFWNCPAIAEDFPRWLLARGHSDRNQCSEVPCNVTESRLLTEELKGTEAVSSLLPQFEALKPLPTYFNIIVISTLR